MDDCLQGIKPYGHLAQYRGWPETRASYHQYWAWCQTAPPSLTAGGAGGTPLGFAVWRLNIVKSRVHKNKMRAHDMSTQNSIRSRENHPRERAFMHRKRAEQYPLAGKPSSHKRISAPHPALSRGWCWLALARPFLRPLNCSTPARSYARQVDFWDFGGGDSQMSDVPAPVTRGRTCPLFIPVCTGSGSGMQNPLANINWRFLLKSKMIGAPK